MGKVINDSQAILRLSAGPLLKWINGGNECYKESSCGDLQPGISLGTDLEWFINKKLELIFGNTYNTQLSGEGFTSNKLSTAIRYYPSGQSKLYTSLNYENIYDQI